MVLMAGFILSSFPPDKISNNPHHNINTIENTHANNTNNDIASRIKSPKAIFDDKIALPEVLMFACTGSINIFFY